MLIWGRTIREEKKVEEIPSKLSSSAKLVDHVIYTVLLCEQNAKSSHTILYNTSFRGDITVILALSACMARNERI